MATPRRRGGRQQVRIKCRHPDLASTRCVTWTHFAGEEVYKSFRTLSSSRDRCSNVTSVNAQFQAMIITFQGLTHIVTRCKEHRLPPFTRNGSSTGISKHVA